MSLPRLGGGVADVMDIKRHVFFAPINWVDLYNKKVNHLQMLNDKPIYRYTHIYAVKSYT